MPSIPVDLYWLTSWDLLMGDKNHKKKKVKKKRETAFMRRNPKESCGATTTLGHCRNYKLAKEVKNA